MECTVYASDLWGAFVPNSQVLFLTEAGAVPRSLALTSDPSKGGTGKFTYRTQCPEPKDVPPLGEAAGDQGNICMVWNPCAAVPGNESRCTPRDGLATLVAITTGGEAFWDSNDNGEWDPGEKWTDLPEPFVDANDNGTRDDDPANGYVEDFYDGNNNGKWDDKNGIHDAHTSIWTAVKIVWTGKPSELLLSPGNDSGPGPGGTSPHCSTIHYVGYLKDQRGNAPTAAAAGDGVTATCTGNCKIAKTASYDDLAFNPGLVEVTISDAHTCPSECPTQGCIVESFSVDFEITRTLDTAGSQATDDLNPVIGVDPAPRVGTFE